MRELALDPSPSRPKKQARPLGGLIKSELFDKFYLRFVDDAVTKDIRSVATDETTEFRSITLAGFKQLRVNKKTHQLSFHALQSDGQWGRDVTQHFRLLQNMAGWRDLITSAWSKRMAASLPQKLEVGERWFDPEDESHPMFRSYRCTVGGELDPRQITYFLSHACTSAGARRVPQRLRTVLSAILARAVWRHLLDPEVLRLTIAIYGPRAQSSDYNRVAKRRKSLRARVDETPSLAPVLGPYLLAMHRNQAAALSKLPDLLVHARHYLLIGSRAAPGTDCPENVALAPPVWRYLARSSRAMVQMVVDEALAMQTNTITTIPKPWLLVHDSQRTRALLILKAIAGTQLDVPFLCVKWLLRSKTRHGTETFEALERAVRLIAQQAVLERRQGTLKAFIAKDLPLVWDYLHREELINRQFRAVLHQIPKNATWASTMRRQREWHETLHLQRARQAELMREQDAANREKWRIENEQARAKHWDPILGPCEIDGFTVKPLTDGNDLEAEGAQMNHCVFEDRFMRACQAGDARVFHLERDEMRSTLLISRRCAQTTRWGIEQHFGWENQSVPPELARVAKKVLVQFRAAFRATAQPLQHALTQ